MFEVDTIAERNSKIFLAQAFKYGVNNDIISFDRLDILHEQILAISNKLITVKVRDSSSKYEIENWVTNAFILISLGLEFASKGDIPQAAKLLNLNELVKFFQIGNTLAKKLIEYAQNVKTDAILVSHDNDNKSDSSDESLYPIEITQEEFKLYNAYEEKFLGNLESLQLNIEYTKVVLDYSGTFRPITSIKELELARTMLNNLDCRSKYYHSLPKQKIFDADFTDLESVNGSEIVITQALMINLALYHKLEFYVTKDEIKQFLDICFDEESDEIKKEEMDFLIGWVQHFLEQAEKSEKVKHYTIDYWRYCLGKLCNLRNIS